MSSHPFMDQIDHVGIACADPQQLFQFLAGDLGLPEVFTLAQYPNYPSGSVSLGNMVLELMHAGQAVPQARYHSLGFSLREGSIEDCVDELERRGIPSSGAISFFPFPEGGRDARLLWASVYLGRILGYNLWMRLFFFLTRRVTFTPATQYSRASSALVLSLLQRAFRDGIPVLTEHYQRQEEYRGAIDGSSLRQSQGGALGIHGVQEVVVGVPEVDTWTRLLTPISPTQTNRWSLGAGPAVRLVVRRDPGILTLVLQVTSLRRARAFIRQTDLDARLVEEGIVVQLPHTSGLTLQLVEERTDGRNLHWAMEGLGEV